MKKCLIAVILLFSIVSLSSCHNQSKIIEQELEILEKPSLEKAGEYTLHTGQYAELKEEDPSNIIVWENDQTLLIRFNEKDYKLNKIVDHEYLFEEKRLFDSNSIIFAGFITNEATICKIGTHKFSRIYPKEDIVPVLPKGTVTKALDESLTSSKGKKFQETELLSLIRLKPSIQYFLRFSNNNNPLHEVILPFKSPYLATDAAYAISKVEEELQKEGLSLMIYQAYVPWYIEQAYLKVIKSINIEKQDWDFYGKNLFSSGLTVDICLFNQKSQQLVDMGTSYLANTNEANQDYFGGTAAQRYYKKLLKQIMNKYGFEAYSNRWWGYTYKTKNALLPINLLPKEEEVKK